MKRPARFLPALAALPLTVFSALSAFAAPDRPTPRVQLAILLDTSGSMEGLINQARSQLWKIVNEFNTAKRGGITPEVEVALFEYGNDSLNKENQWVRQICPLTRDLDEVSQKLFALRTNGGEEYCGAVIRQAAQTLTWSSQPGVYKAIFVAGNEPFTQGPVSAAQSCQLAASKGIVVNTIHCGSEQEGIEGGWKQGAALADGSFICIDQNRAAAHIPCPQDPEIVRLGMELNKTYVGFGSHGREKALNQAAQDKNAVEAAPAAGVSRALTKSTSNYDNRNWDIVDAYEKDHLKLDTVKKEDLPEYLRPLTPDELKTHIIRLSTERAAMQEKIRVLNEAREDFLATRQKAEGGPDTLDTAVAKAVRAQAARQDFKWE